MISSLAAMNLQQWVIILVVYLPGDEQIGFYTDGLEDCIFRAEIMMDLWPSIIEAKCNSYWRMSNG